MYPLNLLKNSSFKLTVTFEGDENRSSLNVTQEGFKHEESIVPHKQGWSNALNDLALYLGDEEKGDGQTGEVEESGYREVPEQQKVGGA